MMNLATQFHAIQRALTGVPAELRVYPPVSNHFSEGVYTRRMFIPKGTLLVGKIHTRETTNICAMGDVTILTEKGLHRFRAGDVIVSAPGIQKVGYAHEDTVWVNVHPTDERDLTKIEAVFVRNPDDIFDVGQFVKQLKEAA